MNRKEFDDPRNWHNRGYIPHYDADDKYQMITYRLADSLPIDALKLGIPHSNANDNTRLDISPLDKGREDSLRSLPSFRTARADLPHTALRSMLTPKRLRFQ